MLGKDYAGQECALASTLEVLGERWTLLIVRDAFFGVRRYSEWVARLDIPRAVLSERLRGLVANGVLARRDDPGHAGRTGVRADGARARSCGRRCTRSSPGATATAGDRRTPTATRRAEPTSGRGRRARRAGSCRRPRTSSWCRARRAGAPAAPIR